MRSGGPRFACGPARPANSAKEHNHIGEHPGIAHLHRHALRPARRLHERRQLLVGQATHGTHTAGRGTHHRTTMPAQQDGAGQRLSPRHDPTDGLEPRPTTGLPSNESQRKTRRTSRHTATPEVKGKPADPCLVPKTPSHSVGGGTPTVAPQEVPAHATDHTRVSQPLSAGGTSTTRPNPPLAGEAGQTNQGNPTPASSGDIQCQPAGPGALKGASHGYATAWRPPLTAPRSAALSQRLSAGETFPASCQGERPRSAPSTPGSGHRRRSGPKSPCQETLTALSGRPDRRLLRLGRLHPWRDRGSPGPSLHASRPRRVGPRPRPRPNPRPLPSRSPTQPSCTTGP